MNIKKIKRKNKQLAPVLEPTIQYSNLESGLIIKVNLEAWNTVKWKTPEKYELQPNFNESM